MRIHGAIIGRRVQVQVGVPNVLRANNESISQPRNLTPNYFRITSIIKPKLKITKSHRSAHNNRKLTNVPHIKFNETSHHEQMLNKSISAYKCHRYAHRHVSSSIFYSRCTRSSVLINARSASPTYLGSSAQSITATHGEPLETRRRCFVHVYRGAVWFARKISFLERDFSSRKA